MITPAGKRSVRMTPAGETLAFCLQKPPTVLMSGDPQFIKHECGGFEGQSSPHFSKSLAGQFSEPTGQ